MRTRRKRPKQWTPSVFQRLTDEELIQLMATAFADRSELRTGDLLIENRIKKGAPPGSIELLLAEAERRRIPLATLAKRAVDEAMAGQSFVSQLVAPSSWKRYEVHAAHALVTLLKAERIQLDEIIFDARVMGRVTKKERQVDLLLKQLRPKRHDVGAEIKEYPDRLIPIEKLEAFTTKIRDIGVDKGVFVTPCGYHAGAIATAKEYGILLFRFRSITVEELRRREPERAKTIDADKLHWLLETSDGRSWFFAGDLTGAARGSGAP